MSLPELTRKYRDMLPTSSEWAEFSAALENKMNEALEANQSLAAIADDMLAALELALEVIEATGPGAYPEAEKQIWDAVSKAKGEA